MVSVNGRTTESLDEIMGDMIISADVSDNGELIFTRKNSEEINAGPTLNPAAAINACYPVGSIYISTVPTNPNTLFGLGTWVRFGKGRTLVSLDEAQTEFDAVEEVGGAKTHTLTTAELPAHAHDGVLDAGTGITKLDVGEPGTTSAPGYISATVSAIVSAFRHTGGLGTSRVIVNNTTNSIGADEPHNNLQPYVVVYVWKRTG